MLTPPAFLYRHPVRLSALLLTAFAFLLFGSAGHDDSHITYTAALQLANTGNILNINGQFVEQSSSLLHVLLLAFLHKHTGIEISLLGGYLGFGAALLGLWLFWQVLQFSQIQHKRTALLFTSISTSYAYWSLGGLETSIIALLMLGIIYQLLAFTKNQSLLKSLLTKSLPLSFCAFIWVRPEGYFVLIAALLGFAILTRGQGFLSFKTLAVLGVLATVLFILTCGFRGYYFGQIFPQPVSAKASSFAISKIGFGIGYIFWSAQLSLVLMLGFLLASAKRWAKKQSLGDNAVVLALAFAASYTSFIVINGGDWMGGGRFFAPLIPLLVLISINQIERFKKPHLGLLLLALLLLGDALFFARHLALGIPVYRLEAFEKSLEQPVNSQGFNWLERGNVVHYLDIQFINQLRPIIDAALKQKSVLNIASVQMGMTPFYLHQQYPKRLQFIDMRGLSTKHLSQCQAFDNKPRIWTGIFVSYRDYLAAQKSSTCALPKLDIIYDLKNNVGEDFAQKELAALQQAGYHLVYNQAGGLQDLSGDMVLKTHAFIAVSDKVLKQLPKNLQQQPRFLLNNYRE